MNTFIVVTALLTQLASGTLPASPPPAATLELAAPLRLELPAPAELSATRGQGLYLLETQAEVQAETGEQVGSRVVLETLSGVGTGFVGAYLGTLMTGGQAPLVTMGGLALGSSLGVHLMGGVMLGKGGYGYTLLGSGLGLAASFAFTAALVHSGACRTESACLTPVAISLFTLPTVGAVIAYEVSGATAGASQPSPGHASLQSPTPSRIVPVVAPAPEGLGAVVGLAGMW